MTTTTTPEEPAAPAVPLIAIDEISALRLMVRGAYDLQQLRMQTGLRLCANFRAKLRAPEPEKIEGADDMPEPEDELSKEAQKIVDQLKAAHRRLTDGVAKNRTLPAEKGFKGDEIISSFSELTLVDQYVGIEKQENIAFRQLVATLAKLPIYTDYLVKERGIGPAMAGVLISYFDPHKAVHISAFWKYGGLDVGPDGLGRSRREAHLVEREYIDKNGETKTRMGITYEPFLKSKLMGVLASSFLRSGSRWREVYDSYKHRISTDPARTKVTVAQWKKAHKAGEDTTVLYPPGRIHKMAMRYMVKMFLAEFWLKWREIEDLPITPTYHEAVLGHVHGTGKPDHPTQAAAE